MKKKRVLVVDDEEDLTWSIAKHLSKDKDKYELTAVNGAKAALEVLNQLPVDLVITDIRMPDISGLDLLLQVRQQYPSTKVIIMTAYGSSEIQEEANKRGCFKYIEKPFEIQDLRKLIIDGVEEKKGFEGKISDLQLSDLIQMNCLGRLTTALHVEKDELHGTIFFQDGHIIHTEVDDVEGEEAFYEIMTWQGGKFSVEKGAKTDKVTIRKGWQSLMLEGMRRADEIQSPRHDSEKEHRKKQTKLVEILIDFMQTKGVILASVFDSEGFPLTSRVSEEFKDKYQISDIVPAISKLEKQVEKVGQEIGLTDANETIIEFKNGFLKLSLIPDRKEFFVVIADHNTNLGLLRMETKKYIKLIAREL
ncbi:MAG: response regulator [Calditrichaceae bacterium]|nr:response regulator [Calditrichaceae bacterium]MBN2709981.1 response regulator [Calditrichaceae bacterium]RQV97320.1 MAG: response regulator [Calditrichota bacterium]